VTSILTPATTKHLEYFVNSLPFRECTNLESIMPKLISLYIRNVLLGFVLSGIFVTALMYFNVANLWHLVNSSNMGWVAAGMLFMFNGIVFAGVQFAIAIMRMERDDTPSGGQREPMVVDYQPIAIPVDDERNPRR